MQIAKIFDAFPDGARPHPFGFIPEVIVHATWLFQSCQP